MTVRVDTCPSGTTRPPFLDHLSRAVYARRLGMYTTSGCAGEYYIWIWKGQLELGVSGTDPVSVVV